MYDSRDDRPVFPGRHTTGHAGRLDCREPGRGDYVDYGTPLSRQMCLPTHKRAAIAEGLAECDEPSVTFGLFAEIEADALEIDTEIERAWGEHLRRERAWAAYVAR